MSGNVYEQCRDSCEWNAGVVTDTYHDGIYDPFSTSGSRRVFRGGSWGNFAWICRVALRYSFAPVYRNYYLGFRVALAFNK